ncbi:MAG: hypothetical protein HC780_19205 [Leptolyngbyaceae cyanobacterium CSU_1_3]|nr:hypothetical protein [Leptolyngbyaceae cyanobacterium CSU_1_3]
MEHDSEAKQRNYLKLLQDLGLTNPSAIDGIDPLMIAEFAEEEVTDWQNFTSELPESLQPNLLEEDMLLKPGEIPAVQDRFHALLKRRLQFEIEQKPPLFPWEKRFLIIDRNLLLEALTLFSQQLRCGWLSSATSACPLPYPKPF